MIAGMHDILLNTILILHRLRALKLFKIGQRVEIDVTVRVQYSTINNTIKTHQHQMVL